jgi:hypothetical protein
MKERKNKQEGTRNALETHFIASGVKITAISGRESKITKYYL